MTPRIVLFACGLLLACSTVRADDAFNSTHVLVVDDSTDEVLLSKDVNTAAPIASLTKLMTAMVVLASMPATGRRQRARCAGA